MQKRKQRKRTDTRVRELEEQMNAMRVLLKEKNEVGQASGGSSVAAMSRAPTLARIAEGNPARDDLMHGTAQSIYEPILLDQRRLDAGIDSLWPASTASRTDGTVQDQRADIIDRGIISMATARHLLLRYRTDLYPHFPVVYIPPSSSAEELRAIKPTLFLAIMAAASGVDNADLATKLDREVLQEYARRTVVNSEKTVELVQSLIISAVWYQPPSRFVQLKYYEYIHMASAMAMDIGICTRPSHTKRKRFPAESVGNVHPTEDAANPDLSMSSRPTQNELSSDSIECRRIFVACYGICAAVAFSLRRPAMMRMTTYTRESLDFLDQSSEAVPGDRVLVAWVRVVAISEEIRDAFSYEDSGGMASILGPTTQRLITAFDLRIQEWRSLVTQIGHPPCLETMYHTIRLFLHELVLHVDYSPEDFKAPYQMGPLQPCDIISALPTKVGVGSVVILTESSHALLELFLSLDPATARALPVFSYVRMSYAVFLLAKLHLSASSKRSKLVSLIDRDSLQAEHYMDRAILHVRNVIGEQACRVPSIFLALLFKLRQWCQRPELIRQAEGNGEPSDIWPDGFAGAQQYLALNEFSLPHGSSTESTPPTGSDSDGTAAMQTDGAHATHGSLDEVLDNDGMQISGGSVELRPSAAIIIPVSSPGLPMPGSGRPTQYARPLDHSTMGTEVPEVVNTNLSSPRTYDTRVASTFFAPWAADEGFGSMFDGGIPDFGDWAAVAGDLETLPEVEEWQMGGDAR
ncbi:hypothetical protein B0A48_10425 [Cryoendolithus antarcticus]|uniref:Transcription factor domain-containing protein n=1 Tax=Cryoendolithus antarcticus TaxID=1507870 RepID=A0A1V8SXA1_9PEZI|nr:hypothetical protein B0A48_10425 [Cryoendolithus antarcticus]